MAGFIQAFVNRPIMATAINLVLLIVGLVAFDELELRHKPYTKKNEVMVNIAYPGGNSQVIEQRVTKPIEDALSGVDGVKRINSTSFDGRSEIFVRFKQNADRNKVLSQVRDQVFSAMNVLPEAVKRPEIREEYENDSSLLYIGFQDNTRSAAALTDYVCRNVEDRLRLVDGVAGFTRFGDKLYTVMVQLDPARLAEQQVTATEVVNALRQEKAFAAGGEVETTVGKRAIVLTSLLNTPSDFEKITIKVRPTSRVTVGDVANVKVVEKPTDFKMRIDGQYTVGLAVKAKPQANPLRVAERVHQFVNDLKLSMPGTLKATVHFDTTTPFKRSVANLRHTLWEAIFLVGVIVTISLASIRAAILPIVTIPLCLVGTFSLMWFFGFSLNPITLLALVLSVGLVVDDAIVVVENIHKHMERGLSSLQAAIAGMKEISFAVIVMTITLAAVYVPIAFQSDETAVIFKEFAWTLAGSVIISGFVALTLTPALCGKFLKSERSPKFWIILNRYYHRGLTLALDNPWKICCAGVLIAVLGILGFMRLPGEFMPQEDEDNLAGYFFVQNEVSDSLKEDWFKKMEEILEKNLPEREHVLNGFWQGYVFSNIILKPREERKAGVREIIDRLKPEMSKIVGPVAGVSLPNNSGMGDDEALKVIVQYSGEHTRLLAAVNQMIEEVRQQGFENVMSEQLEEKTRINVVIDRALANELGVSTTAIEDKLYTLFSGRKATDFNFRGFDYDVEVRALDQFRSEMDSLNGFFVTGSEGQWIPLGSLVSFKEVQEPVQLKHYERMRGAAITVGMKPDMPLSRAIEILEPIVIKYLPTDGRYRFGGKAERYWEAKLAMGLTYGLALVFIYLVLAALFESFIHPLVVLLTVPLSVTGAVWAINAMGGSSNIYTTIGLVTLVGLITKHGILIVDFSNRLYRKGKSIREAVELAAEARFRPVLMTTLAMVCGAVPLVFSVGAGALAREHIGWVIIGGMLTGTFFSLFLIPVVYHLVFRRNM